MDKILTIIIPTYNMERYLHRCLSSLLIGGEDQGAMEVLVVNDGSKDASLSIAREYEEKYPETFRVIDKENGNYGSCINRGLTEATGRYIKVLDADDSYNTEHLHTLVSALREQDVDMFLTDYVIVNEDDVQTGSFARQIPERRIMDGEELFAMTAGTIIRMHEITYRTENLRRMGYRQTEGISYTDMEWTFAPLSTVNSVYCLHIPVYRYLVGRAGQTVDPKVAARSQSQAEKTMFVQVETFSRMDGLAPNLRRHLLGHITLNMKLTYRAYLVTAYGQLERAGVLALDKRLKEVCPELYDIMDSQYVHPRIPLRFIKDWRTNGCRETWALRVYRSVIFPILRKLNIG